MFDVIGKLLSTRSRKKKTLSRPSLKHRLAQKRKSKFRGIRYDPNLIATLKKDHKALLGVFTQVWKEGYLQSEFETVTVYLAQFKALFQAHLVTENVKFYAYLERILKGDSYSLGIVREFRKDAHDIETKIIGFCKTYDNADYIKSVQKVFEKDYQDIARALDKRVQQSERHLYTLYLPT